MLFAINLFQLKFFSVQIPVKVIKDVEASPVYKLGAGLLEVFGVCEDCTKVDVIPLFDVVCSCVLVTLQLGYKALWSSSVLALSKVRTTG